MGKLLKYIADETSGKCFSAYKYCLDTVAVPGVEYETSDVHYQFDGYAESTGVNKNQDMSNRLNDYNTPLFTYFLDGSRRVYKVDDIRYGNKVYPVLAGQIVVTCCERTMNEDNTFKSFHHKNEKVYPVVCLPVVANGDGVPPETYFTSLCNKINKNCFGGEKIQKVLYYHTNLDGMETFEKKGTACIQDEMIDCEKSLVAELTNQHLLSQDRYLIKDGSIQYKPMKTGSYRDITRIRNNYRHVVGVSKQFNPNLMKDKRQQSIASQIAELKLYERTPAFLWEPGEQWGNIPFAVWYVRIRASKYTDNCYSGVLKIEKMLVTDEEVSNGIDTEEVNMITINIIKERNPVCYGNDSRWANHLYPVYMTECYCKSRFMSDLYFINLF